VKRKYAVCSRAVVAEETEFIPPPSPTLCPHFPRASVVWLTADIHRGGSQSNPLFTLDLVPWKRLSIAEMSDTRGSGEHGGREQGEDAGAIFRFLLLLLLLSRLVCR
jgi:hypothetical protein